MRHTKMNNITVIRNILENRYNHNLILQQLLIDFTHEHDGVKLKAFLMSWISKKSQNLLMTTREQAKGSHIHSTTCPLSNENRMRCTYWCIVKKMKQQKCQTINAYTTVTSNSSSNFDMCCSVHFSDSNFYNQQMHTLYFVGHFIRLPTCFDPYGSSSGLTESVSNHDPP
jgi:hypothetical protein